MTDQQRLDELREQLRLQADESRHQAELAEQWRLKFLAAAGRTALLEGAIMRCERYMLENPAQQHERLGRLMNELDIPHFH